MRFELVEDIKNFLRRKGYEFFEFLRGCFDLAARREKLLLLKILTNVDSFQPSQARDLKVLSRSLSASPLVIGKRTRRENLEKDVLYERFGLPVLHPETFKAAVEGDFPHKVRARGGTFGKLNPDKLRKLRKNRGLTQKELAELLGISQKNVSEHERGAERILFSVVRLAEEVLNDEIKEGIDPFETDLGTIKRGVASSKLRKISGYMKRVGFRINYTSRAPPQILAEGRITLMSRLGEDEKVLEKWSSKLKEFSEISDSPAFLIMKKNREGRELPIIEKDELNEVESSKELLKIIEERRG